MATTLTQDAAIVGAYQLVRGTAPGNTTYTAASDYYTAHGESGFAALLTSATASYSNADLAAIVVSNAGLSGNVSLVQYVADLFGIYGADARGQVILNLIEKLYSYTSDATYGAAATAFVEDVANNTSYAQTATNTTDGTISYALSSDATVYEGGSLKFTVTASQAVAVDTVVTFNLSAGSTTAADQGTSTSNLNDFAQGAFNTVTAVIAAGTTTATFTVNPLSDSATELVESFSVQAVVAGNTLTAAATVLDGAAGGAKTYTLTVDQDALTGTSGNDTFIANVATSGVGYSVNTLQTVDVIDGGAGTDTLQVTRGGGYNYYSSTTAAPKLTSIENVDVRFASDYYSYTLDLSNATGVQAVNVANSTSSGYIAGVGSASTLSVSNQSQYVEFAGSTAANLTVDLTNVGTGQSTTVALTDATATTLNLNLSNAGTAAGVLTLSQNAGTATTVNIDVSGDNYIEADNTLEKAKTVNVSGTGSFYAAANTALAALTALNVTEAASVNLHDAGTLAALTTIAASTTAGDVSVQVDASATSVATGSGSDLITYTEAVASGSTIALGAGDDRLVLTAGVADSKITINGGAGTDTLAVTDGAWSSISTNGTVFTSFETLEFTDAVATTSTIDLSKIAGATSLVLDNGIVDGQTLTVTGLASGSTITVLGSLENDGKLVANVTDASVSTDDVLNLVVNKTVTGTTTTATNVDLTASGVETINFTGNATDASTEATGKVTYTLALTDTALTTLNLSGSQAISFTASDTQTALTTINAATNTAGVTVNGSAAALALNVTGSSGADSIVGSAHADVITAGAGADTIYGGAGADTLTGGAGADVFVYKNTAESTITSYDTITDFGSNDKIDLSGISGVLSTLSLGSVSTAADAQTFLQNAAAAHTGDSATVNIAFDTSSQLLYIDVDGNGTADSVIKLAGVTTLTATQFALGTSVQ